MAGSHSHVALPRWSIAIATVVAVVSGVTALALLLLPLVLVLLIVLFDSTAHGVMVLLGLLLGWMRGFLPYTPAMSQAIGLDPAGVALSTLARAAPLLGALLAILVDRRPRGWRIALLLWAVACVIDGQGIALMLSPAMAGALLCSLPRGIRTSSAPGS